MSACRGTYNLDLCPHIRVMDWKLPLRSLQSDFIKRLQSGREYLVHCPLKNRHSELTIISQSETKELRKYVWAIINKYKSSPEDLEQLFIKNLKGKLAEEAFKSRLEHLVTPVNYDLLPGGDGKVDFWVNTQQDFGIQVKARHGAIDKIQWVFSPEEVRKNKVLVCILIQEEVSDTQAEFHLIHAGFIPTELIESTQEPIALGIKDLLYCGGLACYLEHGFKPSSKVTAKAQSKAEAIAFLQDFIAEQDEQQQDIGFQIPPGPQRIRGIAGSGKTVLLCQKAAQMYVRSKREGLQWRIALVFFTRSLYEVLTNCIDQWLRLLSNDEIRYDPNNPELQVLPAWGNKEQPGFYTVVARSNQVSNLLEEKPPEGSPPEKLAFLCKRVLSNYSPINPMFDAILIEEGQDLVVDNSDLLYEQRQTIYWLAWQSLRPVYSDQPHLRRLIWAYDEAQSLDSRTVPTSQEVLGENLSQIIGGEGGSIYPGGIRKAHVMKRCYRTPGRILTIAHAMGMGWLRSQGLLKDISITNKREWQQLGYEVLGDFRKSDTFITLHRPPQNSPNPTQQLWSGDLIQFQRYEDRASEVQALVKNLKRDIEQEGLKASRDILVINLGDVHQGLELEKEVTRGLSQHQIDFYIPGAKEPNNHIATEDRNRFWYDDAITVSRIQRAKGHEAYMVYVLGLDNVAQNESDPTFRNQLFIALTRARAWVTVSGIGNYPLYAEMQRALDSGDRFTFKLNPTLV